MVWLNDAFGGKFPIEWSLGIIATLLSVAIVASWLKRPIPAAAISTKTQEET
jgi:tellurite resistance protein TerC